MDLQEIKLKNTDKKLTDIKDRVSSTCESNSGRKKQRGGILIFRKSTNFKQDVRKKSVPRYTIVELRGNKHNEKI